MIFRLLIKVLLVMFALPALGLIAFHGGIGSGIGAAIVVGLAYFFTKIFLIPWLISVGLVSVIAGGAIAGNTGALAVLFAIRTAIYSIALWISASLLASVALVGFWPTIGAGAILALVSALTAKD